MVAGLIVGVVLGALLVEALHVATRRAYHDRDTVRTLHTHPRYADARAAHPTAGVPAHMSNVGEHSQLATVYQLHRPSHTDPAA